MFRNMKQKLDLLLEKELHKLQKLKHEFIGYSQIKNLTFNLQNLNNTNLNLDLKGTVLYIIKFDLNNKINLGSIKELYKTNKQIKQMALPRINNNHWLNQNNYLYIGTSKNINKRLQEHLGINGSNKTYALHLSKWVSELTIDVEVYEFANNKDEDVQLFEDLLWEEYKPLFGRRGRK